MPKVTVAIPTYNREDYLREAIASVLVEKDIDLELLVVDTNSPVNVKGIVDGFADSRLKYFYHPVNLGMIGAGNKCIELSVSEFYMSLSDDDRLLPHGLKKLYDALVAEPDAGAAIGSVMFINEVGQQMGDKLAVAGKDICLDGASFYKDYIAGKIAVQPAAILIRKSVLDQVGQFDPLFEYCPDMDLWLRIALKSKICLLADALGEYRIHGGTATAKFKRNAEIGVSYRDLVKKQYDTARAAAVFSADELESVFKKWPEAALPAAVLLWAWIAFAPVREEVARQYFAIAGQLTPNPFGKLYLSALTCASFAGQSAYGWLRRAKRLVTH